MGAGKVVEKAEVVVEVEEKAMEEAATGPEEVHHQEGIQITGPDFLL